jgi:hypothetical protein
MEKSGSHVGIEGWDRRGALRGCTGDSGITE